MKKIFSFLLFGVLSLFIYASGITIGGKTYAVDTIVHSHDIGPGTKYAFYDIPAYPLKFHVMEVDLTNPYVDIETCLSGDKAVATETPSSMSARNNRPGHEVLGATNGDFYQFQDPIEIGIPRSGQYRRGECVTNPVGRASFVLTPDRVPYIDRVNFAGTVRSGDNSHRLHAVNMQRLEWETETAPNFMLLYTNAYGTETHATTGGTKVMLHAKEGELFFGANKNIVCVVDSVFANPGISPIPEQRAVLYGVGTAETFLKSLSAGDELTVFLGTDLASTPGLLTDFKEQMGGSDHIILKNGVPADVWDEEHPRTCMGISQDKTKVYLMVVDGRRAGYSAGATLSVLGDLFLAIGAYDAVNLDGGGSSAMVINQQIVNRPSDNKERAVGNGVLVISKAPIDDVTARLEFEPIHYILPSYCRFIPQVTAYNQYGLIVNPDFKDYTLSCSPEIGYIDESNAFVAYGNPGHGTITATYNGISVTKDVTIQETDFAMRLDSVILDGYEEYPIEISAIIDDKEFVLNPSTPQWEVADPEICGISNGVLSGLKNGVTTVTGKLDDFTGSLKVKVEIPESPKIPADDFSGWTTKSISSITDAAVTPSGNNQAILGFTYKTGRLPYVEMDKAITLYSIPDTLRMLINSEIPVSKIQIACKANGDKEQYLEYEGITVNEDYLISIPLSDITGENNRGGFPVSLNYIKFYINTTGTISGQAYKIHIKEFSLVYNGIESGIDETVAGNKNMVVYPNPITGNTLFLQGENIVPGSLIRIYDRVGALILEQLLDETGIVNIGDQQPGVYIVNVQNELGTHVCKIVIQ